MDYTVLAMPASPQIISLSVVSARTSAALHNETVRLWASVDCFVKFGDETVEAITTDHPLTARTPEDFDMSQMTHVAGIVSSGTGVLFVSKLLG
jgi:hypothetical protein